MCLPTAQLCLIFMAQAKVLGYFLFKYAVITTFNNYNAFNYIHVKYIQYFCGRWNLYPKLMIVLVFQYKEELNIFLLLFRINKEVTVISEIYSWEVFDDIHFSKKFKFSEKKKNRFFTQNLGTVIFRLILVFFLFDT